MKLLKIAAASLFLSVTATASDDYRTWTDTKSGRTVEAKAVDKKIDSSEVQIQTKQGKKFWLKAVNLNEDDQEYITEWHPAVEHLTVRVLRTRKGWKTVVVTASAGNKPLVVTSGPTKTRPYKHVKTIAAGETEEYEVVVSKKYKCVAREGDKIVDQESYDSKTGL